MAAVASLFASPPVTLNPRRRVSLVTAAPEILNTLIATEGVTMHRLESGTAVSHESCVPSSDVNNRVESIRMPLAIVYEAVLHQYRVPGGGRADRRLYRLLGRAP